MQEPATCRTACTETEKRDSKYETESLTDSQAQEGFPTPQESIRLNNYSVETCIKELKFLAN